MTYETYEKICNWLGLVFWAGFFFFQGMYLLAIFHLWGSLDLSSGPAPYVVVGAGAAAWFLLAVVATWSGRVAGENDIRKIVERSALKA